MTALTALPYTLDALSPVLGGETLCLISQKILPSYQAFLPNDIKDLATLTAFIQENPDHRYAHELYQHLFWLHHLKLDDSPTPSDFMMNKLNQDFGSFDKFLHEFKKPLSQADGLDYRWLWLISNDGKLSATATKTQSILTLGKPILACNLWQHAYFLEYPYRTEDYIHDLLGRLIDWRKCEQTYQEVRIWGSY